MPLVATIDGIKIQFYWDEHPPPHFHAEFGEYRAQITIQALKVIKGGIPAPQLRKVIAWAAPRKSELLAAWMTCLADENPGKIR